MFSSPQRSPTSYVCTPLSSLLMSQFNLVWYQSHCGRMLCAFASIRRRGGSPVMSIHASFGSHGAGRWRKQFGCCSTICLETWWCWCYPVISLKHVMLGLVCPSCFSSRWGLQIQKGWSHSGNHRWKDRGGGQDTCQVWGVLIVVSLHLEGKLVGTKGSC